MIEGINADHIYTEKKKKEEKNCTRRKDIFFSALFLIHIDVFEI